MLLQKASCSRLHLLGIVALLGVAVLPIEASAAALMVTSAYPTASTGKLDIYGAGFGSTAPTVTFAGFPASVVSYSDTTLTVSIPYGLLTMPGTYLLSVSRGSNAADNSAIGVTVGQQGPKGDAGPAGPAGSTGATGAKGAKGDTGPAGAAGPIGPKGDTGATGAVGATGPKGDTGLQGIPGSPSVISAIYTTQQSADISSVGGGWVTVPGTYASFSLPQRSILDLEANGSIHGLPGNNSSLYSHCGLRFVVDNTAYGDLSYGDVIVGCGTQGSPYAPWWCPWFMRRTIEVEAGIHSVSIQQAGVPGTTNGCTSESDLRSAARLKVTVR